MHVIGTLSPVLGTLSKHHLAGIVGIVVGALLVVVGGVRVATRASRAILVPVVGLIIVVLAIPVYARVY